MFTIDASVWINAVSSVELAFKQSRAFLDFALSTQAAIVVPTLLTVEIVATIARRNNQEGSTAEIAGLFQMMATVQWISLDEEFSKTAADVALRSQLRTGDAVYAAVALENDCILVSLDKDHQKRLAGIVNVMTPEQALIQLQSTNP
jgi:predicted nucleic acid-binding protein